MWKHMGHFSSDGDLARLRTYIMISKMNTEKYGHIDFLWTETMIYVAANCAIIGSENNMSPIQALSCHENQFWWTHD